MNSPAPTYLDTLTREIPDNQIRFLEIQQILRAAHGRLFVQLREPFGYESDEIRTRRRYERITRWMRESEATGQIPEDLQLMLLIGGFEKVFG